MRKIAIIAHGTAATLAAFAAGISFATDHYDTMALSAALFGMNAALMALHLNSRK